MGRIGKNNRKEISVLTLLMYRYILYYSCADNYPDIQGGGDENENEKRDSKSK